MIQFTPLAIEKIFKDIKPREKDSFYPDKFKETQEKHRIRLIETFLNKGFTDMTEINTIIRVQFTYTSGTMSACRKKLQKSYLKKYKILK